MQNFILFCKSYRKDVFRAKRLVASITRFNEDKIPFYLSVPQEDLEIFTQEIDWDALKANGAYHLIKDESIVQSNTQLDPKASLERYFKMPSYFSQQVIKAEAWRLIDCENYLCLDSEAVFMQPFFLHHFMANATEPFTILHPNTEFLTLAKKLHKNKEIEHFFKDNQRLKEEFGRTGEVAQDWDFGPAPLIWSKKVWQSLEMKHLIPKSETIWDAIERLPFEIRWYGEALLKFKAIPLHPHEPLFQVIHYDWQRKHLLPFAQTKYLGILSQSNWDKELDPSFARKPWLSRMWRKLKMSLK
jgi:Family of unknown function (DUF6492)